MSSASSAYCEFSTTFSLCLLCSLYPLHTVNLLSELTQELTEEIYSVNLLSELTEEIYSLCPLHPLHSLHTVNLLSELTQ